MGRQPWTKLGPQKRTRHARSPEERSRPGLSPVCLKPCTQPTTHSGCRTRVSHVAGMLMAATIATPAQLKSHPFYGTYKPPRQHSATTPANNNVRYAYQAINSILCVR